MSTTLTTLIDLVRRRLGDHVQEGYDTASGDGEMDRFALTHVNLVADSLSVLVDDVAEPNYTVDEHSGWVSFGNIPAAGTDNVVFSYQYTVWSDERITEAINAAIDELFGKFYVHGYNDDLWSDGTAECVVQTTAGVDLDPEDRITKVEFWSGSRWVRIDRWKVSRIEDAKTLVFEFTPTTGTNYRVHYVKRPGNLESLSQTLEVTGGLPTRAKEPIVLLACADLITDRIHHRIRDDRGHNTQGENPVKSYEIQNDAQFLRAQAELKASKLRMSPLMSRVAY